MKIRVQYSKKLKFDDGLKIRCSTVVTMSYLGLVLCVCSPFN